MFFKAEVLSCSAWANPNVGKSWEQTSNISYPFTSRQSESESLASYCDQKESWGKSELESQKLEENKSEK